MMMMRMATETTTATRDFLVISINLTKPLTCWLCCCCSATLVSFLLLGGLLNICLGFPGLTRRFTGRCSGRTGKRNGNILSAAAADDVTGAVGVSSLKLCLFVCACHQAFVYLACTLHKKQMLIPTIVLNCLEWWWWWWCNPFFFICNQCEQEMIAFNVLMCSVCGGVGLQLWFRFWLAAAFILLLRDHGRRTTQHVDTLSSSFKFNLWSYDVHDHDHFTFTFMFNFFFLFLERFLCLELAKSCKQFCVNVGRVALGMYTCRRMLICVLQISLEEIPNVRKYEARYNKPGIKTRLKRN